MNLFSEQYKITSKKRKSALLQNLVIDKVLKAFSHKGVWSFKNIAILTLNWDPSDD